MQKLMSYLPFLAAIVLATAPIHAAAKDPCNIEEAACLSALIKTQDQELNRVYQLAINAMPEKDLNDNRKARQQLLKSQRAWLQYRNENCALVGGQEGGDNRWVAHFAALCQRKETDARIAFLKAFLAAG